MNTDPTDYPLTWPEGHGRVAARVASRFKTSLAGAMKNIRVELDGFGRDSKHVVKRIVISTNATISNHRPDDPGVAVWFLWCDAWHCYAVDLYRTVGENLQAIAKVIEADRVKLRHAGIAFFRSTFKPSSSVPLIEGPGKVTGAPHWRDVIDAGESGGSTCMTQVNSRWRRKMRGAGTDQNRQYELNAAREAARKEFGE